MQKPTAIYFYHLYEMKKKTVPLENYVAGFREKQHQYYKCRFFKIPPPIKIDPSQDGGVGARYFLDLHPQGLLILSSSPSLSPVLPTSSFSPSRPGPPSSPPKKKNPQLTMARAAMTFVFLHSLLLLSLALRCNTSQGD